MRRKIKIKLMVVTPSSTESADYTETFTTVATVWAMVRTVDAASIDEFDGTNREPNSKKVSTHEFYIRYRAGITAENQIEYNNTNYDIVGLHNVNEYGKVLRILCNVRGPTAYTINKV